jgi:hypothetical protein
MPPVPLAVFLLMLAFLMFALAACGLRLPRVDMISCGLALWVLSVLVRSVP